MGGQKLLYQTMGHVTLHTAEVFTNLMREYSINHITSSPHYPQSNGLAEMYVQIIKNLFYKVAKEGKTCSNV